ncbi:hypothetical protein [Fructobacillus ficulneus]|uniref:Uncharacterized protein n=1 Tax=Fructobacillus ficulneus TaxID=157463 RepID=A0A0K8MFM3_9LACO|nr:hypothetical protein [Fructobacillus ficulneus]GAO99310.1 hypothetical protein FFIC_091370 [Fructobacillus ficulneus]
MIIFGFLSLIVLFIYGCFWFSFKVIEYLPYLFLIWLVLEILIFVSDHFVTILIALWALATVFWYVKKHHDSKMADVTDENPSEPETEIVQEPEEVFAPDVTVTKTTPEIAPEPMANPVQELADLQKQFAADNALNLGDGLSVDTQSQQFLIVLDEDDANSYILADFADTKKVQIKEADDLSKVIAVHFQNMPFGDFVNLKLSNEMNPVLGQSPAGYFETLLAKWSN